MDGSRFDQLTKRLGEKQSRRRSLAILAGAAAVVALPVERSLAGTPCALICPPSAEFFDTSGTCSQAVFYNKPTVPGGCAGVDFNVGCTTTSGELFPLEQTVVTCNSTDPILSCQFTVTGFDSNQIFATCPADINLEAAGPTSVTFEPVLIGTACTPNTAPANCTSESGDIFPLGTTTVICTVPQGAGGPPSGSCSFNITLAPAASTATPTATDAPAEPTATEVPATTVPGQPTSTPVPPTATDPPSTVAPTSIPGDPSATATAGPVTGLPNTGTGGNGSGGRNLLPIAAVGVGAALLVRLGLRQTPTQPDAGPG